MIRKIFISIFTLVIITLGWTGWHYYALIFRTNNVILGEADDHYFYIPSDADYQWVLNELQRKKVVHDAASFDWVASLKKYPENVKPGRFPIDEEMSNNELVNTLRSANTPLKLTFSTSSDLNELAGKIGAYLEPDSTAFYHAFSDPSIQAKYGFNQSTFISLFIPNTYEFYWNTTPEEFLTRMAKEYRSFWNQTRKSSAKKIGLSQSEVATLASIVQAETNKQDEMPIVAGLYINRIKRNMKLQADPTVKFALGDPSKKRIYLKDLKVDSPYNTYRIVGLPPGPIAMPTQQAMLAVLNHEKHTYIYMCAQPNYNGYHNFASNYREHERNRKMYQAFLRRENIR